MGSQKTIAVCGKGGVGKTTISALIVKSIVSRSNGKILAIDADPAVGLSYALGIEVAKTVDDIRNGLIDKISKNEIADKIDTLHALDYEIFEAIVEHEQLAFLAIGRPEGEGCYCEVNLLLKDIIESLAAGFDFIIIDGEAGLEQINRRVMKTVDYLILVSDSSAKGLNVVKTIKQVADEQDAVDYKEIGLLLNRINGKAEADQLISRVDFQVFGWIPEDHHVREYDFSGKSYLDFPDTSPTIDVIGRMLEEIGV